MGGSLTICAAGGMSDNVEDSVKNTSKAAKDTA